MGYRGRSAARLAAVQILYTQIISDISINDALAIFMQDYSEKNMDDVPAKAPDLPFLTALVRGVVSAKQGLIDRIQPHLKSGWDITRLDPVLLNILLCGAYELIEDTSIDSAVLINEYLDVGHAFFDQKEVSFINKVLDGIKESMQ